MLLTVTDEPDRPNTLGEKGRMTSHKTKLKADDFLHKAIFGHKTNTRSS